jgi:hypothetical protein
MVQISQKSIPENSLIVNALPITHYADCFYAQFEESSDINPENCIRYFFYNSPGWIQFLLKARSILMKPFGLRNDEIDEKVIPIINVRKGCKIGVFEVKECTDEEVLLYMADKHLDACLSIQLNKSFSPYEIYVSTIVQYHNIGGRIYFFFIRPFHILIMRSITLRLVKYFTRNSKLNNYENSHCFNSDSREL